MVPTCAFPVRDVIADQPAGTVTGVAAVASGGRLIEVASGVRLFTTTTPGPRDRSLLVIHGGPDWDHSYLREPVLRLAGQRRVVMPDLRGCGRSTTGLDDHQYTPDAVVADLVNLLDRLELEQASVLGFSYGGLIAQRLAVARPRRVRRLIVASSSVLPFDDSHFGDWPERITRRAPEAAVWSDPLLSGAELTRAAAIVSAPANVWRQDALRGYLQRLEQARFGAEWLRPWQAGTLPSPRLSAPIASLNDTGIPIMLLHGRQDMVFPAVLAEQAQTLLDHAVAVILDQAGHMAHIDQPADWLAAIADFTA